VRGRGPVILGIVIGCAGVTACGVHIPDPPEPIGATIVPELEPEPPLTRVDPQTDDARFDRPPAPPLTPLAISVEPARPRQASVVSIRIRRPAGPPLEDLSVRLAGRAVRVAPAPWGWFAVGGLPVDSAGFFELEVSGRRAGVPETERRVIRVTERTYPSTRIGISAGAAEDPEVSARIEREAALIQAALHGSTGEWLPTGPFDWPRPPVRTSPFGQRRVFNGSVRSRHLGLDLRGQRGAPVYAPAAGRVVLTGSFYYQGNAVYVDHGLGLVTAYFHFSSTAVEIGQTVEAGDLLGRVGSTGRSTAPHLHWSAYVDGENVDPESLVGFMPLGAAAAADRESPDRMK